MKLASAGRAFTTAASAGIVIGAAGVSAGLAAGGVGLAALEVAGRSHRDLWSNGWAVGGLAAAGGGLLIVVAVLVTGLFRIVNGIPESGGRRMREDVITGIVSVVAGVPAGELPPDKNFVDDFAVDSSSLSEIAVAVEERFGIEIPDQRLADLKTVRDFADLVSQES